MEKKAKASLSLGWAAAFTWFGGHCGSGFASGRQIVQYTTRHGIAGWWIPILIWVVLGWFTYWSVEYGRIVRARTYKEFARSFFGKFAGPIMGIYLDIAGIIGAFIGGSVMFAAGAQLGLEALGLNYTVGSIIIALICCFITVFGYKIYSFVNAYITIPMIVMILTVMFSVTALNWNNVMTVIRTSGMAEGTTIKDMLYSAYAYGGLQSGFYGTAVALAYLGGSKWTHKDSVQVAWGGAALNCIMHLFNVFMIYGGYPRVNEQVLVTRFMINEQPSLSWLLWIYQIVLILAIITTAIGIVYGQLVRWGVYGAKLIPSEKARHTILGLVICLGSVGMAAFGLTALVARGYSLIGNLQSPSTVIPVSIIGIWRLNQMRKKAEAGEDILMSPPPEETVDA